MDRHGEGSCLNTFGTLCAWSFVLIGPIYVSIKILTSNIEAFDRDMRDQFRS